MLVWISLRNQQKRRWTVFVGWTGWFFNKLITFALNFSLVYFNEKKTYTVLNPNLGGG